MDSIKALEKIGLKEVSRKTYIELSYLKLMAERDFAKLNRIKTLGFVKIIKRECGIDMSDWVEEFEIYLQEQSNNSEIKNKEFLTSERWYADSRKRFYVIAAVLVLIIIIAIFYLFLKGRTAYVEDVSSYTNIVITNESLQSDKDDTKTEETKEAIKNSEPNEEIVEDSPVVEQNPSTKSINKQTVIVPNIEIWVGMIDLSTFKRNTYLQNSDIKLDTTKEQIIVTGHGDFSLRADNEIIKSFNPQNMIYLHIQNGEVKQISEDEFILLNRGKIW
ncbi:MAG: hypothetical protein LBL65_07070 [Campylobacteraceae bacterium]|jgi:hypothetical protein|nr:hypothetical protein [Campylobacteraceae bacterium]